MIRLTNIGVTYRFADGRELPALRGITLSIASGEKVAVLGPNASGKSTLALLLAGLISPTEGQIECNSDTNSEAGHANTKQFPCATLLFQDPDDNLIGDTPVSDLALSLEYAGKLDGRRDEALRLLSDSGLAHLADRPIRQLSGGEKQSVALASALATLRPLLILDEPTSHLDPPSRRILIDRILDTSTLTNSEVPSRTVVLITQYIDEAERFPRVIELHEGEVRNDASSVLLVSKNATSVEGASRKSISTKRPLLTVRKLNQTHGDQIGWPKNRLTDISLEVNSGDCIALVGPMGAGKSTLAYHLAGLMKGEVTTFETTSNEPAVVMIQFPERQLFRPTALEDVRLGCEMRGMGEEQSNTCARDAMGRTGLEPKETAPISAFAMSGGQRRRVALASILACPASIYILDEPTASLDADGIQCLEKVVHGWSDEGRGVVLISHDLKWLRTLTSRVWVLDAGRLRFDGSWSDHDAVSSVLSDIGFE